MKLNIGENIRNHRRNMNITQEQFAEKIGVSFQAVSRWENGITYPDMELLPAIANFFGISIDQLMGMPEEEKEEKSLEALHNLAIATYENPIDKNKIIALIRDIRRNHLGCSKIWQFWLNTNTDVFRNPEILPEVRLTVEAILNMNADAETIRQMAVIEDDDNIDAFINKYASIEDISRETLLIYRYKSRGEWDKLRPAQQWSFYMLVDKLIGNSDPWRDRSKALEIEECKYMNEVMIDFLHKINKIVPDETHPISGNGEMDFFAEPRLWMGFRQAAYLASSGESEKAIIYLEDSVSLLEKVMKINEPVEIKCSSPWLDEIVWTAQEEWLKVNVLPEVPFKRCIYMHINNETCYTFFPSMFYNMLTKNEDWLAWFEPIQENARYKALVERIKALVAEKYEE